MNHRFGSAGVAAVLVVAGASVAAVAAQPRELRSLKGSWTLDSAYEVHPDGARATNFGAHPLGLLTVDAAGRYNLQIFRVGRPAFASGDKTTGTADEYRQAALGSSTHFGTVRIDAAKHQLVFTIQGASFPNWEGKSQVRDYSYKDGLLTYAVPASASGNGVVAWSVWRRMVP